MANSILVKKQSGEQEPFSENKLRQSLGRSGADPLIIDKVTEKLKGMLFEGITTREIYQRAFMLLRQAKRPVAARFSIKKAIMELGPTGFPFEQFIGEVLKRRGFSVTTGQTLQGKCVTHEVDVIAMHDHQMNVIECKFHNHQGKVCNVKVPLYINSRFKDIESLWKTSSESNGKTYKGWVVTNTRFTSDAIQYGECAGLHLVSWDHPRGNSLREMIEESSLFPITAITRLNMKEKQQLLLHNIVLCRQLVDKPGILDTLGITASKKNNIINEAISMIGER